MNIIIGKLGRTTYFCSSSKYYTVYGGEDNFAKLFITLARLYPQHKFYCCSGNDLKKKTVFSHLPNNLIDFDSAVKTFAKENNYDTLADKDRTKEPYYKATIAYCEKNNIKFDYALCVYNCASLLSLYREGFLNKKGTEYKLLQSMKAASPITYLMNNSGAKVIMLYDDPREIGKLPIDLNKPTEIYSQNNGFEYLRNDTEHKNPIKTTYREFEKVFLIGREKIDFRDPTNVNGYLKDLEFSMFLNGTPTRFDMIKKWVFDYRPEQVIYGRWLGLTASLDKTIKDSGFEKNFVEKGMMQNIDLPLRTKYTFIPPVEAIYSDFVTQKAYSMIYFGIIPFWDKHAYDSSNIYKEVPDYFKVETPDEMWEKINFLNANEDVYKKYLNELYDLLKDEYFDGSFLKRNYDEILATC